jgi:hypothetical protein
MTVGERAPSTSTTLTYIADQGNDSPVGALVQVELEKVDEKMSKSCSKSKTATRIVTEAVAS